MYVFGEKVCRPCLMCVPLPSGSTHYHYPPSSHCTLSMFPIPHLTEVWQAYSAVVTSCSGVRGGLLSPWYPHTPLLYDNGTGHLELSLSLQVVSVRGRVCGCVCVSL